MLRIDAAAEKAQVERVQQLRANRDNTAVSAALTALEAAARSEANVCYPLKAALRAKATVGEVCDVLRSAWGTYEPTGAF